MKFLSLLLIMLIGAGGLLLTGCESASPEESNIPWSRPKGWEGQAPGMGDIAPGRDRY